MKNNFIVLLIKEIYLNYLVSPLGFIFAGLFSTISLWLFFQNFFLINQATLVPLFDIIPFLFLFFLPAITMNLFADEKKNRTWEILLTLPVNEAKVILAKFLSSFIFSLFSIFLTTPAVVLVLMLGNPDIGVILSGYLGIMLIAGCYLSTGLFFSSLTDNPIIAFITSIFFLLINFFAGQQIVLQQLPEFLTTIISSISLNYHFGFLIRGHLPLNGLIFYLSWIGIFIWLTIISLKSRDH
jgi:ABC-2 type transport system permease protein